MKLFESAWDGDIENMKCLLKTGVPVDVTLFVSSMVMDVCIGYMYVVASVYQEYTLGGF